MKSFSYLVVSLGLASCGLASPTKKSKCGAGHVSSHSEYLEHYSSMAHYPVADTSSSSGSMTEYAVSSTASSEGYPASLSSVTASHSVSETTTASDSYPAASGTVCTAIDTVTESTTETDTTTSTPSAVSTTTTQFETLTETTTLDQSTSTHHSTSTVTETSTVTDTTVVTSTIVNTATTTESPPTSTITTAAGFTPIRSVYNDNNNNPSKRAIIGARGTITEFPSCTSTTTSAITITDTTTSTTMVEAPTPTSTQATISTITTTSTVMQDPASTTEVETITEQTQTTTTATITTITTSTTTSTEFGPTPTYYAMCDTDNILSEYHGGKVQWTSNDGDITLVDNRSPYECCVLCQNLPECAMSLTYAGTCVTVQLQTCTPALSRGQFLVDANALFPDTVSNGRCGQWELV